MMIDCPREAYDTIEALNISRLKRARVSPRHYQCCAHRETPSLALGTLAHMMTLEPHRVDAHVAVWDGKVRRGKDWDAFEAENGGRIIAKPDEIIAAQAIADAVHSHPVSADYLRAGAPEVTLRWDIAGRACKGRADWIDQGRDLVVGIKTGVDIAPRAFGAAVMRYGYDLQWAWYADGYETITGRKPTMVEIVVESREPHDVIVYRVPAAVLDRGRSEYQRLLQIVTECERTGVWPGQAAGEVEVELPAWAYREDAGMGSLDEALTFGGAA